MHRYGFYDSNHKSVNIRRVGGLRLRLNSIRLPAELHPASSRMKIIRKMVTFAGIYLLLALLQYFKYECYVHIPVEN